MKGLKKELGLFEVTLYGVGIILGAGIYALIGEGAMLTGNSLWLSFVIGAVIAGFTGISYAELATMFPQAAAEYVYVRRGLRNTVLAFLVGWLILFTGAATVATVSLGFAGYFTGLIGGPPFVVAVVLIVALAILNYTGIKQSSRVNISFTLIEIGGLLMVIILGFTQFDKILNTNYLEMKAGMPGVLAASALVFFAYVGFEDIANIAEEAKNPQKILARAFMLAVVITTVLYVLTSVAALSMASSAELGGSKSPLALAVSNTFLGARAFTIMSIVALFATANTVLVAMIVGSRMAYGIARDKSLPEVFSRIDKKRGTPSIAILAFTLFSLLFLFAGEIGFIANMTSLAAFMTFALVNASLIALRFSEPRIKRPFKSPVNIGRFPVIAFVGFVSSSFMIFQFTLDVVVFTLIVTCAGLVIYFLGNHSKRR